MSEAWQLTRAIARRSSVRVAVVDSYGTILNDYSHRHRLSAVAPTVPWAVNLADASGEFHLLAFDLDTTHASAEIVQQESDQLTAWLAEWGVPVLVCRSGPTGGRHVWVGMAEPLRTETVAMLATALKRRLTTLDIAPLMNPSTGAVRPPGAPHRQGGHSEILSGHLRTLTHPITRSEPIERWVGVMAAADMAEDMATIGETVTTSAARTVARDATGRSHISGQHRPLPAASQTALATTITGSEDASALMMRVLVGAAAACWTLDHVRQLVTTAPGLEYARTRREGKTRTPRPPHGQQSTESILIRQWERAVKFVAAAPQHRGCDVEFDARASAITDLVARVQERADAMPGRWATGAGPTMRRVLDALCLFALRGVTATVEADQRRLALLCGIGAQTARRSLARLTEDGWLALDSEAVGSHGHRWTLAPTDVFHTPTTDGGPQGNPPPAGATRISLLATLTDRLTLAAHDIFTPRGLGHHAGNLYARANEQPTTSTENPTSLRDLVKAGLVTSTPSGWIRTPPHTRDMVALWYGTTGTLSARALRFADERELWAWWRAELTWMCAPQPKRRPKPYTSLFVLGPNETIHGAHPRHDRGRSRGRADFAAARRILTRPAQTITRAYEDIYRTATREAEFTQ
ncbi:hypothetical protein [Lysinibacter sp. HNR]|uniref:hypothetical protein n=1 Tax=Lysinibacter sp. HNR TaxID=3031408 RepID=UPI0024356487|nr:hypothetical protein [Lysinibacter sp. HNR]WGD37561.1 hypothetical protein FrondiHNR_01155 [Lysinibacter sp. HNR]